MTRSVERRCDRTGKCTEYTTLFGSLARAAGIPTRVALGQRRFAGGTGDSWGGHMWNEVFVGAAARSSSAIQASPGMAARRTRPFEPGSLAC